MNKILNSVLFIILATLVNVAVLILLLVAGFFLLGRLAALGAVPQSMIQILSLVVFAGSIIGAFVGYNRLLLWFASKVDMEKYFHPIIQPKKKNN
ncbi:MAG: hypothetical protein JXB03_00180 [Spirochaetales bacterium]|nr:hypothetical protein [Spirochaetales bacterium]